MTNTSLTSLALIFTICVSSTSDADEAGAKVLAAFKTRCVKCHGGEDKTEGEVNLLKFASGAGIHTQPELLEKVIAVLKDRQMPPEDEPPLPDSERQQLLSQLEGILRRVLKSQPFGITPIRRMNRFQYNNAVVDLLELDRDIFQMNERLMRRREDYFRPETGKMPDEVRVSCRPLSKDIDNQRPEGFREVAAIPQDKRAEHGFDNRADHLTLSPLLMESFLRLSQTIAESPDLNAEECGSWSWLFASPPNHDAEFGDVVRERLQKLLRRAFRRPADPETLTRFTDFAVRQLESGRSFEETMRTIVGAVLGTPEFLYLYESEVVQPAPDDHGTTRTTSRDLQGAEPDVKEDGAPAAGRQRVSEFQLATRLSQFFWSSIPDDTLLDLAEAGKLSSPEELSRQIDRMMNDRRAARFCDNFPGQWLQLERLVTSIPDREKFPYFYYHGYRTSMHMMSEPLLLFETVFVENRSVIELLDPGFTWQSDMLRSNYQGQAQGGHDVQVQVFKRTPIDDPRRGGVITNAAVLTMTSTPVRTQPITRGAWINAVIFNDPPEPPPADVPPLPEGNTEELAKLTIRERLAVHRKRADCAGCHNKLDPLGFALENFGPTGIWRDKYENGRDVDVAGKLFNQHEFKTLIEFKQLILQQKHRFIRGFAAHLLSYALGRELGPADSPALDAITEKAMNGQDSFRTILKHVAMSEPFLHRTSGRPE